MLEKTGAEGEEGLDRRGTQTTGHKGVATQHVRQLRSAVMDTSQRSIRLEFAGGVGDCREGNADRNLLSRDCKPLGKDLMHLQGGQL